MPRLFSLHVAEQAAAELEEWLGPVCKRLLIVGSVRRQRALVHDIDIAIIPRMLPDLTGELSISALDGTLAELHANDLVHVQQNGPKIKRLIHTVSGIPVDIYLAENINEWWPLVVIRTGSAEFNRSLCHYAKTTLSYTLHADGRGVETLTGKHLRVRSERALFQMLGLRYLAPGDRDDGKAVARARRE